MKLITLNIPEVYLKDLDELVKEDLYPNRAEAIRVAVRDMLVNEVWDKKKIKDIELQNMVLYAFSLKEIFEERKIQDLDSTSGEAEFELSLSICQLEKA